MLETKSLRLETADGHFVADVRPLLPIAPTEVLFWGTRVFLRARGHRSLNPPWREVTPTVVVEP